eukprot:2536684-Rhodomonas_salina.3
MVLSRSHATATKLFGAYMLNQLCVSNAFMLSPSMLNTRSPISRGAVGGSRGMKMAAFDPSSVKAISLDVTGTILVHRDPIMQTYAEAAVWAKLPNPPTEAELKPAFKAAYFEHLTKSPCFGTTTLS